MSQSNTDKPQYSPTKKLNIPRPFGCFAGLALGFGFTFLVSWIATWFISALLTPLFGQYQGGNTGVGVLLSALTCGGSMILAAVIAFLVGRMFPVFRKGAR